MVSHKYDNIVLRFLAEEEGVLVLLSDDTVFARSLRGVVSRDLGIKGDALYSFSSPRETLNKCIELRDNNVPAVLLVERMLNDRPTTDFIISLKKECPNIRLLLLTWQATPETVAYLFELGVGRVLVKPASADKVIQELAGVIRPSSELQKRMKKCARLLRNEEYDEALELTDRILLLKPSSARGLAMRGDALMGIGETDQAVQSYMAAHEAKPIFMAPLIKLATAFREMEDERALSYMKMLDEISPLNPERKIDIAEQHLKRNEPEEAEAYMDRGVEMAEQETLSMVSDLTERIVDAVSGVAPNLAVKYLNRVIDNKRVLGRDDLVHFNRLGIILRGEGKWQEAVQVYEKALEIVTDDPVVHYNMGLAYWEGNERMKAVQCFERAMDMNREFYRGSVGAALNIGSLYLDLRQYQDAEPFFEHVLEIDPENRTARKRLKDARDRIPPQYKRAEREKKESASSGGAYDMDALVGGGSSRKASKSTKSRKSRKSGKRSGGSVELNF
ncbi:tetratricopeptide repeat protein [Pseudodesulfovibrio sp. zrk46]|uniref:tetratricopeptide repeat protein n=1 Tax=Pseudodesulfovibrio sp. zrk46 TaxID=2725288 RepID=UPI001449EEE3|nr:tetratricopeptide repeat protein [Pseudodesulfovibrio sp. zrk46]QJB56338.1 tetratricopeptide repeat protein [Pseudodesulfovibrio sp. zrk46]